MNLITFLELNCTTILSESLNCFAMAHELVITLSVEMFPGSLQTEQKNGGWREALENEMRLKHSEGYHKIVGSKFLVGSSSAPYSNSKYSMHMQERSTG